VSASAQEREELTSIIDLAQACKVSVERVDRNVLDKQVRHVNHQGVALETSSYPYVDLETCLEQATHRQEPVFLLMLDHVQDPQNAGTLIRTAEVAGIHGIILPGRRGVGVTPAVVNASSGATEHLCIVSGKNLDQTIRSLQRMGVWVVGVEDDERSQDFDCADIAMPLALVVGAEGKGLARLTRERCDFLVRVPMRGQIASLNVAVAGSIVVYYAWRQRVGNQGEINR
jgi:23S rRNA (guanosine2251-2'-O)-methyltransferase